MNLYTVGTKYPEFVRPGSNDTRMDFDDKNRITIIVSAAEPIQRRVECFKNEFPFLFCLHYYRGQILVAIRVGGIPCMHTVYQPHKAAVLSKEEFMAYYADETPEINLLYVNSNTGELLAKKCFHNGLSDWFHEALVEAIKDKLSRPYDAERDQEILAEIYRELPDSLAVVHASEVKCMISEHPRYQISKRILINNFEKVEAYLELYPEEDGGLHGIELRKNRDVRGVNELLALIPGVENEASLQAFYEETGLNIRVEDYDNCAFTMLDRNGSYPRKFLNIWSPDFHLYAQEAGQHPEWFEPQEEADIVIRHIRVRSKM